MIAFIQKYLEQALSEKLGIQIFSFQSSAIGCGSINDTYRIKVNHDTIFFIKINSVLKFPNLFEKEKNGIEFLRSKKIISTPAIVACDIVENYQVLILEWIEGGLKTEQFWEKFGVQLATLHLQTFLTDNGKSIFGFGEDNYMGALTQKNTQTNNWNDFFIQCRLQPQIKLARDKQFLVSKHIAAFENLYKKFTSIFNDEKSSLLHGDLWSGNFMCNENAEPILIDPAVYFGHRSMDLAMTTLFGGFDKLFYESYNHYFPFPGNYAEQWEICNLYPLLIHLNLFGRGYLGQIETALRKFS